MKSPFRAITALGAMVLFALSAARAQTPFTVNNFSFEADNNAVPSGWTGFNLGFSGAVSGNYNQNTPLAASADGNNYFAMNQFPRGVVGGSGCREPLSQAHK